MACECDKTEYIVGESPVITIETRDPDAGNALFAAASVGVEILKPDGTTSTANNPGTGWTNPSTGIYKYVYALTLAGVYWVDAVATRAGGAVAKDRVRFTVVA